MGNLNNMTATPDNSNVQGLVVLSLRRRRLFAQTALSIAERSASAHVETVLVSAIAVSFDALCSSMSTERRSCGGYIQRTGTGTRVRRTWT